MVTFRYITVRQHFPWSFLLAARLWLKRRALRMCLNFMDAVNASRFSTTKYAVHKVKKATAIIQRSINHFMACNRARKFVLTLCWHKVKDKLRAIKRKNEPPRKLSAMYAQFDDALQASVDAGVQEKSNERNFTRRFSQA